MMIKLINSKKELLATFESYEEAAQFLQDFALYRLTNEVFLDENTPYHNRRWSFIRYDHATLSIMFKALSKNSLTKEEKKAIDLKQDLVEMYCGYHSQVFQTAVDSKLDISEIQKGWCFAFCRAFKYKLVDSNAPKSSLFKKLWRAK
jgi:hypothetical protein